VLEPLQVARVAVHHRVADFVARLRQRVGLRFQRLLQRQQLGERARRGLPHGRSAHERAVLVHHLDLAAARPHHAARRRLQLTHHQLEQRGLARAVAPHDAPPLAGLDAERHVLEEHAVTERDADAAHGENWHGRKLVSL